jgi:hypothetical protein
MTQEAWSSCAREMREAFSRWSLFEILRSATLLRTVYFRRYVDRIRQEDLPAVDVKLGS